MTFALNMSAYLLDQRADLANALREVIIDENRVVRIKFLPILTRADRNYVVEKFTFVRDVENMHDFTLQLV
jgi:hypothetical protein